jgi:hypothetical protein
MDMFSNRSRTVIGFTFFFVWTAYVFAAQTYYSPISINSGQVPSTQTDFPVLVSQTDNRFKTTGNGGHVANSSGFDIRPYSDTGLSSALTYELERYNGTTGEVVMWVKVASLSSSTTPIYLGYGDAALNTDGSSASTWDSNFLGVYHLKDGTTLSVASSTGANNGTNHSATAAAGKVDGAGGFASGSSQYIDMGTNIAPTAITLSAWVNATSFPGAYNGVVVRSNATYVSYAMLFAKGTGKLACYTLGLGGAVNYDGTGSHTLSTATWYYLTMTYSSSAGLTGYVNASSDGTAAANGAMVANTATSYIGNDNNTASRFWNGSLDEVRISNIVRTANWITTEYNNQNAPGTFETLGTEVQLIFPARGWFHFFPR